MSLSALGSSLMWQVSTSLSIIAGDLKTVRALCKYKRFHEAPRNKKRSVTKRKTGSCPHGDFALEGVFFLQIAGAVRQEVIVVERKFAVRRIRAADTL